MNFDLGLEKIGVFVFDLVIVCVPCATLPYIFTTSQT